jgi:Major tropism determinant N-terminal domain
MATRMQQRRGTAAQWTAANPILASGEIGFETDTNQFKMGDGTSTWTALSYFKNLEDLGGSLDDYVPLTVLGEPEGVATLDADGYIPVSQLANIINGAPQALDTLNEIANAIDTVNAAVSTHENTHLNIHGVADMTALATNAQVSSDIESGINTHNSDTTGVHGIADTAALATTTSVLDAIGTHSSDTTDVHGIADTSLLATQADVETHRTDTTNVHGIEDTANIVMQADLTSHANETLNVHGIANTADLATESYADGAVSDHNLVTTSVHGIADTSALATSTDVSNAVDAHNTDTTSVHGIADTAELETQTGAQAKADNAQSAAEATAAGLYATIISPTMSGSATVENITVTGNLTVQGTTTTVDATNLEVTDSLIYLSAEQFDTDALDIGIFGAYGDVQSGHFHTGIVRDASDGKWKLISAGPEPVSNVIDFSGVTYDTLKLGGVEFSDGTQTKQGVASLTPIVEKTASYTLSSLTERDTLIEVNSSSATTITIPANSAVAYPVGTSIDILQTSTGQVTIAGAGGVTVNATPGLKLRTQWSSATLFKRAENVWVVMGDLTA